MFCLICFQTANANWVKQNSGTLAWLRTGFFVNEKTGWIGGSNGTLLTTENGGDSWRQTEKFTSDTIRQIYFSDEKNGWLLCERDIYSLGANSPSYLLKTSNGGADWEKVEFLNNGRSASPKFSLRKTVSVLPSANRARYLFCRTTLKRGKNSRRRFAIFCLTAFSRIKETA